MKQKGQDYSKVIIWSSALVGMIRYAAAFLASDLGQIDGMLSDVVTFLLGLSGFFMGILGTLGVTYIFDGWRQKMPATGNKWPNKFMALTGFVMAAFITEILILVPFTMSRVLHVSVADVLDNGVWWWSTAVVIMPILLIGGVSLGNQIVTVTSGQMSENGGHLSAVPSGAVEKVSVNVPSDWRKAREVLTDEQVRELAGMRTGDICYYYGIGERQARRWREKAREEVVVVNSEVKS